MKKYESNKARKILLATLAIPVVISSITPVTFQSEEIYANSTSDAPILRVYESNGSPKLEWATEILKENIIIQTGFEPGQAQPFLNWSQTSADLLHYLSTENSYSGNYNYLLKENYNKGNHYAYPETTSNNTIFTLDKMFGLPNGIPLSLTFKARTDGTSIIRPSGDGNWADSFITYNNKIVQNAPAGATTIYLDTVDNLQLGQWITDDVIQNNPEGMYLITNINRSNNSIEINWPLVKGLSANLNLKSRNYRGVFTFDWRTVENRDWETYSINTFVNSYDDYNIANKGFTFYMSNSTDSKLQIDDITFGYATEVEVYRDGQSIYKGYLSDFHDKTIHDNVKPNKVSSVNGSVSNDFNVHFNIVKPIDNGVKANYQIQSIAQNGNRSALSSPQEIEIKTDVVKYKYIINNQEIAIPVNETNSLNDLSIPLKSINLETDYLHVQAIDANGNTSDIESFKVKDILDTSNLQNLYDKLKDLEDNNDYLDFIDFIDELEGLFGDNLPQDLKDRLAELGKYHGVNTSFLLLEEGDFRLTTSDINDFGKVKLTAAKQTVETGFSNDFGIIDARGTQEGWNVTVSATPFTVETFDGFIGKPHQLPIGSLALNGPTIVEQVGTVHNSQLPDISLNQLVAIDGGNQTIQLLNADKQKGMGEFKFSFGTDALALTVDAVTAKIDKVNYPDQNTPYSSTVTWNLISGPQI